MSRVTQRELLDAMIAQTQAINALIAVVSGGVQAAPVAAAPAPKAPAPKKAAPAPKAAAPKAAAPVATMNFHGHSVAFKADSVPHTATGWTLRRVATFDGEAIVDSYTDDRRAFLNGTLPCSKMGCPECRAGNNQFCAMHRSMKNAATRAWKAAGKPKIGTPEYAKYMGTLPKVD